MGAHVPYAVGSHVFGGIIVRTLTILTMSSLLACTGTATPLERPVDMGAQDLVDAAPDVPEMSLPEDMVEDLTPDVVDMTPDVTQDMAPDMPPPEPDPRDAPGTFVAVGWRETLVSFRAGELLAARDLPMEEQYNKGLLLRAATWGPQGFVAVGDRLIYQSMDALEWTARDKPANSSFMSGVAYGNGRYVAAGGSGALWSEDGEDWSAVTVMRGQAIRDLAFGGGVFVVVGDDGFRARSVDGETWTDVIVEEGAGLNGVAWGQDKFVAVGAGGRRLTSPDGVLWENEALWEPEEAEAAEMAYLSLQDAVWAKGQWVVVGRKYLYTSSDAVTWTQHETSTYFAGVTYGAGAFYATAGQDILTSSDGITWTPEVEGQGSGYWGLTFHPDQEMP